MMHQEQTLPTFTVITPCYNAVKYIEETVESVLNQRALLQGRARLQYFIVDGASKDGTLAKLELYRSRGVVVISESDLGMYDALSKGFARATGDFVCYINAGDYYHSTAFDVALDIFEDMAVDWIVGMYGFYNDRSQIVKTKLPLGFRKDLLQIGAYGRFLPSIQQESTMWRISLLETLDINVFRSLRLAGDSYLWYSFAKRSEPVVVEALFSGFRFHPGQLSEAADKYCAELQSFSGMPKFSEKLKIFFEAVKWYLPRPIQRSMRSQNIRVFDHKEQCWRIPGKDLNIISNIFKLLSIITRLK